MLKTQVNRVNVLEDGTDRLGLINLEKIPIKESVKIKHGKRIFVPMEFSALGMRYSLELCWRNIYTILI